MKERSTTFCLLIRNFSINSDCKVAITFQTINEDSLSNVTSSNLSRIMISGDTVIRN